MAPQAATQPPKRLDLLHELLPALKRVAFIEDFSSYAGDMEYADLQPVAAQLGVQGMALDVRSEAGLTDAFAVAHREWMAQARFLSICHRAVASPNVALEVEEAPSAVLGCGELALD